MIHDGWLYYYSSSNLSFLHYIFIFILRLLGPRSETIQFHLFDLHLRIIFT